MPTKKTPKKAKKQNRNSRKVVVIATAVLLLAIVGLVTKAYLDRVAEKKELDAAKIQLDKADQQMGIIYDRIVAEVGQPQYTNHQKSCSYPSLKFEKGKPSCGPSYFMVYGTSSKQDGESLILDIKQTINTSGITKIKNESRSSAADTNDNWVNVSLHPENIAGTVCSMSLELDDTTRLYMEDFSKSTSEPLALGFSFNCSKNLAKPIY